VADWPFTLPAILVQAATGVALAKLLGYPLFRGWLAWARGCNFECEISPECRNARVRPWVPFIGRTREFGFGSACWHLHQ